MTTYLRTAIISSTLCLCPICACGSPGAQDTATETEQISAAEADTVVSPETANLANPLPDMPLPLLMSGNFGELRRNHFHSGLDFKTGGVTGKRVVAADSGYVSRVTVSPWGFGRAVYVTHPHTGLTTVYGHLEAFAPRIDRLARNEQYAQESFNLDMEFTPDQLPVRRGELIGRSGNAGSSGGPHLHTDVRHTATGDALDPLPYYSRYVKDTTPPQARSLALYAVEGKGVVLSPSSAAPTPAPDFKAWGKVYPSIKAYDRMPGVSNIYGVKHLWLEVDGREVYRRTIDRFSFADTRAVNSLVHYPTLNRSGSWMMVTRIPQADPLYYMIDAPDGGIINIDRERKYKCVFVAEDAFGNRTRTPFTITGVRSHISPVTHDGKTVRHDKDFEYHAPGIDLRIPAYALYDDIVLKPTVSKSVKYLSPVYTIGDPSVPLHKAISLSLTIPEGSDASKLVIVRVGSSKKGRDAAVESKVSDGKISANITAMGGYAIASDTEAPVIRKSKRKLGYIISDNLSGIAEFRGEIDGKFALFEYDGKNALLTFEPDPERFPRTGKSHEIVIYVRDAAGNRSELTDNVIF